MGKKAFSIVITGEWPGAGQSTTAKLVANLLGFERVYAGELFRKFAHVWRHYQSKISFQEFTQKIVNHTIDLENHPFIEDDFNEQTLHTFQHQLKTDGTPDVWDKIIDTQSLQALKRPGVVVEAKVGVLLDKTGLGNFRSVKHKIYKVLLICPPEISAHRVIKRKIENQELPSLDKDSPHYINLVRETTQETINRHLRDWERYEKIYGIFRSDIYRKGVIKINTAQKSPQEVAQAIIDYINHQKN